MQYLQVNAVLEDLEQEESEDELDDDDIPF